jgi:hypothetical protein
MIHGHIGEQGGSGDNCSDGSLGSSGGAGSRGIVFLASDEASFISGHILNVDGGKSH